MPGRTNNKKINKIKPNTTTKKLCKNMTTEGNQILNKFVHDTWN